MDMVPQAQMINTELPIFFFFFYTGGAQVGRQIPTYWGYFWGGRTMHRAVFSRIYFTN